MAFSGGVDSSVLLAEAVETLDTAAIAAIIRSPLFPDREYQDAVKTASRLKTRLIIQPVNLLEIPGFRHNPPDRCYRCKSHIIRLLLDTARRENIAWIVEGSNRDDTLARRPGMRALKEQGVRSPLMEAGLTKREIRNIARMKGLPCWNKPAEPCLATRIPYGEDLTPELLKRIEKAEGFLLKYNFPVVRVRDYGDTARIEVDAGSLKRLFEKDFRTKLIQVFDGFGYRTVTVDPEGYRSGSMDSSLRPESKENGR